MKRHSEPQVSKDHSAATPTRRRFLSGVLASVSAALLPRFAHAKSRNQSSWLHLQDCRIAGSHYYALEQVMPRLRIGATLQLQRQADNPHDERAIEVFWHQHKLGYLPRLDNAAAASLLDRTHSLRAEIIGLDDPDDAWEPLRLRLWVAE